MTKRRRYSAKFKREAVALTRQPGVSCRQVALEIGISPTFWPADDEKPTRRQTEPSKVSARKDSPTKLTDITNRFAIPGSAQCDQRPWRTGLAPYGLRAHIQTITQSTKATQTLTSY